MPRLAHPQDVLILVAPGLRAAVGGRREVSLGLPATAGLGEVIDALFTLYPGLGQHLAGDRPATGGLYLHLASSDASRGSLAPGHRLYLFSLSRPSPGEQGGSGG